LTQLELDFNCNIYIGIYIDCSGPWYEGSSAGEGQSGSGKWVMKIRVRLEMVYLSVNKEEKFL